MSKLSQVKPAAEVSQIRGSLYLTFMKKSRINPAIANEITREMSQSQWPRGKKANPEIRARSR
jgi:hypothetical protein